MTKWLAHARFIIGALALMLVVALAAPAAAHRQRNPDVRSIRPRVR